MITISKRQNEILISIKESYNKKAQQLIELLAIKYFATRTYKLSDNGIESITYIFKNEIFLDDLFVSTLIGNLLHTGLNIFNYSENNIYFKNVS